jgi:DNA-binding NarL/FixJ family response regulator
MSSNPKQTNGRMASAPGSFPVVARPPASSPPSTAQTLRVVVADHHLVFLHGLKIYLSERGDFDVVATSENGKDAYDEIVNRRPDVALVNADLVGLDALDLVRRLQAANVATPVVIMAGTVDDQVFIAAIRLGVRGFLVKSIPPPLIADCLRQVHAGGYWLEKQATTAALGKMVHGETNQRRLAETGLTRRELEIARLGGQGVRTAEISRRLNISPGTVKLHLHQVYKKLGVPGRIALMVYARDHGLG